MRLSPLLAPLALALVIAVAHAAEQRATTTDGKPVILRDDGTWEYADGGLKESRKPWVKLPISKTEGGFAATLLKIRRVKTFGDLTAGDGSEIVVVHFVVDRSGESWDARLIDANGNSVRRSIGFATTEGPQYGFEVPEGRQLKTLRLGPVEFDLTAVRTR